MGARWLRSGTRFGPLAALAALSLLLSACGDSLVDHLGVASLPAACPSESVNSCGPYCGACPAAPANAVAACLGHACSYGCSAPWIKCESGCCLASAIAAGGDTTCAIVQGAVRCWGAQLGSSDAPSAAPLPIAGLSSVSAIAVGPAHACAIVSGGVRCWGDNAAGQLGQPAPSRSAVPLVAVPGVSGATAVAVGERHSCARTGSGIVCWGANDFGQLGDGTQAQRSGPVAVAGTSGAASIAAGLSHSCAVVSGGVSCWGAGASGQIGNGSVSASVPQPAAVRFGGGGSPGARTVVAGQRHGCALLSSSLACWGAGGSGQIGDGGSSDQSAPRQVNLSSPTALAAGRAHTCAAADGGGGGGVSGGGGGGGLKCWGANDSGQLGTGDTSARLQPFGVPIEPVQSLASGADHTCALLTSGGLVCWGRNDKGQTGIGSASAAVLAPAAVTGR
jgi:alpha-tubulin suppressor-like RCC1 family protein